MEASTGKESRTIAPIFSRAWIETDPAWRCITCWTIGSPSPVPPSPLVVKKGSMARWAVSEVIPVPSSITSIITCSGWDASSPFSGSGSTYPAITIRPPSGMASIEFSTRFVSASRISVSTPGICGSTRAKSVEILISPPLLERSRQRGRVSSIVSRTICLMSTGSTSISFASRLRYNWRIRSTMRDMSRAPRRISWSSFLEWSSRSVDCCRSISEKPTTGDRALLMSCAIPPAICPRALKRSCLMICCRVSTNSMFIDLRSSTNLAP